MRYQKVRYPKRQFTRRYNKFRGALKQAAFSSNSSTQIRLTTVLQLQAAQLRSTPVVLSTHAPVHWNIAADPPSPPPSVLSLSSFYRLTNALSLY